MPTSRPMCRGSWLPAPVVLTFVAFLGLAATAGALSLAPRLDLAAGDTPLGIGVGDIDGDGLQDLVVAIHEEDKVAVFRQVRGAEPLQFAAPVKFGVGPHPQGVAVADFDGDGKPDVAVANSGTGGGGTLAILHNESVPAGVSLTGPLSVAVDTAHRVVAGDLDGDGKLDLAVSAKSPKQIFVIRNASLSGTLAFVHDQTLSTGEFPNALALADLDGDGGLDILAPIGNENSLAVYRNQSSLGSVSFSGATSFTAGTQPGGVVAGLVDGDASLDVIVSNVFADTVSLFLNSSSPGNLSLETAQDFAAGSTPSELTAGDLDGDGLLELVIPNDTDTLSVLEVVEEEGGGISLALERSLPTGETPVLPAVADLDGDGLLDIIVSNSDGGSISIFRNAGTPPGPDHLLLCEVASSPTPVEFIELVNPTDETFNLEDYYLSDDQDYALLPGALGAGPAPSLLPSDFIAGFPAGASIGPGEVVVVAMDGAGFEAVYKFAADYELGGTDAGTPDLDLLVGSASATLTDSGENVVLFRWDGVSDLVEDVDMVRVGRPAIGGSNDIANKTGLAVDGPDADTDASTYLDDAFTMPEASSDPGAGESVKRALLEGPSELAEGGNGATGHDETSEDILVTWDSAFEYTRADPGTCCLTLPCYYAPLDPTDGSTLRSTLHEVIDDHLRWSYDDVWEILELADEDPLNASQIVDVYKNAPYLKVADRGGYQREHAWPKSYGFPIDLVSNYPFTDAYHLFLADGSYNESRSDKPYRRCDDGCDEKVTIQYDGRGGGSG